MAQNHHALIPKTVHYCWFGRGPLPDDARRCIDSWRRHLPGYEIREWNEDNFDVRCCPYVAEAYGARKYAFVSDYARFWVLYHHGGLYFDTDVELIRPLDHIVEAGNFMGIEKSLATEGKEQGMVGVNPGLGLGAEAGMPLYREILDHYESIHYQDGGVTVVTHTTEVLRRHGYADANRRQRVAGVTIYPADVFCPMDSTTGIITKTPDTVSIHHYSCSWMDRKSLSFRLHLLKNKLIGIFGPKMIMRLSRLLKK